MGLLVAFALTRLLSGMLYGVTATDPVAYSAVAVALLAIALAARATFPPAARPAWTRWWRSGRNDAEPGGARLGRHAGRVPRSLTRAPSPRRDGSCRSARASARTRRGGRRRPSRSRASCRRRFASPRSTRSIAPLTCAIPCACCSPAPAISDMTVRTRAMLPSISSRRRLTSSPIETPSRALAVAWSMRPAVLRAASALRIARFRTSPATTAKPLPRVPRAGRLHRRVEREEVGLERDLVDRLHDPRGGVTGIADPLHGLGEAHHAPHAALGGAARDLGELLPLPGPGGALAGHGMHLLHRRAHVLQARGLVSRSAGEEAGPGADLLRGGRDRSAASATSRSVSSSTASESLKARRISSFFPE